MLKEAAKVTAPLIRDTKGKERITSLTAYDFQIARIADEACIDIILVGDSLETVVRGAPTTLTATMPQMLYHLSAVRPAIQRALCAFDLPFGSFHLSVKDTVRNAVRAVKKGAEAVKIEGGVRVQKHIKALVDSEIPVIGHIGLTPQSIHRMGGYKKQRARDILLAEAKAVEDAGAFAVVLEVIEAEIAAEITAAISIPAIGIGSGTCDGQILVVNDLIGLLHKPSPSFAKQYANVGRSIAEAIGKYADDVRSGSF